MLTIAGLTARAGGRDVLAGVDLRVGAGELHAIMGPNGGGKSTLAKAVAGHPEVEVTGGSVSYSHDGAEIDLLSLEAPDRAKKGVFLGFQYPVAVPGITNMVLLRESFNEVCRAQGAEPLDDGAFGDLVRGKLRALRMDEGFLGRFVNDGLSGGEKKKNELLQMAVLSPRLAVLDEIDSGLDVDALKTVAAAIRGFRTKRNAVVLVTHYQRILGEVEPDAVHVLSGGTIVESGGRELAVRVEREGYGGPAGAGA